MEEPLTNLIIDIETLGIRTSSVILSIGCVPFKFEEHITCLDEYLEKGFYVKFNVIEQLKAGRTTDTGTIEWWKEQSAEARSVLYPSAEDVSVLHGLRQLTDFIDNSGYSHSKSHIWARGQDFDFPKIADLCYTNNFPLPYNTWMSRDIRTYIDVLTGNGRGQYSAHIEGETNMVVHNALFDCAMDAIRMTEIYKLAYEQEVK